MAGLAALTVVALVAAGVAVNAADEADLQRRRALSRQLVAQSEVVADPVTASLLAVAAWRIDPTPEARHRLLTAAAQPGRGSFTGGGGSVTDLQFTRDGTTVVTMSKDHAVRLWDTASRRQIGAPIVHPGPGCVGGAAAAISPDGRTLAVACFRTVLFWDVSTRRQADVPLEIKASAETLDSVRVLAFSPDGRTLAAGSYEGTVRLLDVAARRQIGDPLGRPDRKTGGRAVNALAFTPDGKRLVSAGADGTARLWDLSAYRQVGSTFSGHTDAVHDVSISPDGATLATASTDGTSRLWSLGTHRQLGAALREPDGRLGFYGIEFSPDGGRVVTAGADGFTRLWDVAGRQSVGPRSPTSGCPSRGWRSAPTGGPWPPRTTTAWCGCGTR
ncbi:WD40 repeat domain-containing protein [Nonomuraea antimicrobica]